MAWDGNGAFTRTDGSHTGATTWQDADAAGDDILASTHDTHDEDLADGIQACLTKNNESKPTADFKPNADVTYSLGSSALQWVNAFISGCLKIAAASTNPAQNLINGIVEGRLTLTTAVPVTTSDVTAAETLYFTPYKGNRVSVFDGTHWQLRTFTELSIDVPDATNCYDVFIYDNAGTLTLELTAWTNETTRATALTTQNGVLVKTGVTTRRYLGTFYSTTAGNGQIEDSFAKRNLWNYYNRVARPMRVLEDANTWQYTTATLRQANGDTANQLECVTGVSEDEAWAQVLASAENTGAAGSVAMSVAIGLDSTTTAATGCLMGVLANQVANAAINAHAQWRGFTGVGRHTLVWLEYSTASGTTTWYGDAGTPTRSQSGIHGGLLA